MESTEKHYSKHGMGEGDPGSMNPNEHREAPDKNVREIDALRVEESEAGHYSSRKPDTENLDQMDFQVDEGTKAMMKQKDEEK